MRRLTLFLAAVLLAPSLTVAAQEAPVREGFVDAGRGVRLYYRTVGNGADTVLMLHGGPGFSAAYFEQDFGRLARNHTLLFFDQRGTGRSTLVTDSSALDAQRFADDVEAVRKHFRLQRVALFGHSWGAAVAALYAMRYPERVSRILLLGPVPTTRAGLTAAFQNLNGQRDSAETRLLAQRRSERMADTRSGDLCRAYYVVWFRPAFRDSTTMRRSKGDFCAGSPEALANKVASVDRYTFVSLGDYDWRPSLRRVTSPTLIIHGRWEFMPLETIDEWLGAVPNSRVLLLERGGHFAYLDAPDEFFRAADAFLSGEWPTRARARR